MIKMLDVFCNLPGHDAAFSVEVCWQDGGVVHHWLWTAGDSAGLCAAAEAALGSEVYGYCAKILERWEETRYALRSTANDSTLGADARSERPTD